jgi:hypothetical protein
MIKNGFKSVFAFSGLLWSSFVGVFLGIAGYRRSFQRRWWIHYSLFLAFQTASPYLPFFFRISKVTTDFFHPMKHRLLQKEDEARQLTSYEKS